MLTVHTRTNIKKNIVVGFTCVIFLLIFFWFFQKAPIPVNQDEFLPIFSKSFIEKNDFAKGALSRPYSKNILGKQFPVLSYPYIGSLKGILYHLSGWPSSVTAYRAFNLIILCFLLVAVVSYTDQFYQSNWLTKLFFTGLLFGDISFLVISVTDEGPILLNMLFGIIYVRLLYPEQSLTWWKILLVGLAVFLGVWDRINFIWFALAGIGSSIIILMLCRTLKVFVYVITMIIATFIGLLGVYWLIPSYFSKLQKGAENSIPLNDFSGLWDHWQMLSHLINPFTAFHRYVDVTSIPTPLLYNIYEWTIWFFLLAAFLYGCFFLIKSRLKNDPTTSQLLYLILVLASLCFIIVKTRESWSSHHIITIKPYLYLVVSLLATREITSFQFIKKIKITLLTIFAVALALISAKGYSDMLHAKPIGGFYDVSWNSIDAVKSACNSKTKIIYALDWGVFYPGAAMSRPDQRWEMKTAKNLVQLQKLNASYGNREFGVLFKIKGPHQWIYTFQSPEDLQVADISIFDRHKGESWVFANIKQPVMDASEENIHKSRLEQVNSLINNGEFINGTKYWTYTKYEIEPDSARFTIDMNSDFPGKRSALITHINYADSRIIQEVTLKKNRPYLVSAYVKTENVGVENKGAYLCIMDISKAVESLESKGNSVWQKLKFIVIDQSEEEKPLEIAARLGGYGSMNTGKMWVSLFTVTETEVGDQEIPTYYLK